MSRKGWARRQIGGGQAEKRAAPRAGGHVIRSDDTVAAAPACPPSRHRISRTNAPLRRQSGLSLYRTSLDRALWGRGRRGLQGGRTAVPLRPRALGGRSEEHTSELQSLRHLVCRLLLE